MAYDDITMVLRIPRAHVNTVKRSIFKIVTEDAEPIEFLDLLMDIHKNIRRESG